MTCYADRAAESPLSDRNGTSAAQEPTRSMASFLSPPEASDALIAAAARESAGDFNGALDIYRALMTRDPEDFEARYRAGTAMMRKGDLDEAVTLLRQVVFTRPEHGPARANLGNALLLLGRYDQAREAFLAVLDFDRDNRNALYGLSTILIRSGRHAEAAPHARRLLKAMPESAAALTLDADAQAPLGNVAASIAQYRHALRLDEAYVPALKGLARILFRQARHEEALDAATHAVARGAADAEIMALLGSIHLAGERWSEAIEAFADAQELEPDNPEHPIQLSHACRKAGDLAGALSNARAAWELDADNRAAGNALGTALAAAGAGLQARSVLMAAGQRDRVPQGVWRDLDVLVPQLERQAVERAQEAADRAERLLAERQQPADQVPAAEELFTDPTSDETGEARHAEGETGDEGERRRDPENLPLFPGF